MGGIWMANSAFVDSFIEVVGFKSGLVITHAKVSELVAEFDTHLAERLASDGGGMRMESTTYEEVVAFLLHKMGLLQSPRISTPAADVYHRFKNDPDAAILVGPVGDEFLAYMETAAATGIVGDAEGVNPFLVRVHGRYGDRGADIALEYLKSTYRYFQRNPWTRSRQIEWSDTRELVELFASEKLDSMYGRFFDQRFIDYIAQNFEEIDRVHWRQFEGVTAEFFERQGFRVELGPGRNDGGVDVRVFPAEPSAECPPLILVQCKRQRERIGKTLVKSVYADVQHERAQSGLIVTTSALSPGAEAMRNARGYPVEAADRPKLRTWIEAMRRAPL